MDWSVFSVNLCIYSIYVYAGLLSFVVWNAWQRFTDQYITKHITIQSIYHKCRQSAGIVWVISQHKKTPTRINNEVKSVENQILHHMTALVHLHCMRGANLQAKPTIFVGYKWCILPVADLEKHSPWEKYIFYLKIPRVHLMPEDVRTLIYRNKDNT